MRRVFIVLALLGLWMDVAHGQGVLGDVLAGKLVKPKVGQWAWYDLSDTQSGRKYALRQAIVGKEDVGGLKGFWLEVEIVPEVGYPTLFKMLVTGPAGDPQNVHRILQRQGTNPVVEVEVSEVHATADLASDVERRSLGKVSIETPSGRMRAEHVTISSDRGAVELWINDDVRPMGIARMRAAHGELIVRAYGTGGDSAISKLSLQAEDPDSAPRAGERDIAVDLIDITGDEALFEGPPLEAMVEPDAATAENGPGKEDQ